jgi:hypothetical protein
MMLFFICILLLVRSVIAQDTSLLAVKRSFDDANVSAYISTEPLALVNSIS